MSKLLQTTGPSVLIARFDTGETAKMRPDQLRHLSYHIAQVFAGQASAVMEWEYFGIQVEVEPDMDQGNEA